MPTSRRREGQTRGLGARQAALVAIEGLSATRRGQFLPTRQSLPPGVKVCAWGGDG